MSKKEKNTEQGVCSEYLVRVRWNNHITCPYCSDDKIYRHKLGYFCNECKHSFSSRVKTIFHNSKVPLEKWFQAIAYYFNHEDKARALWISEHLELSYPSARRMLKEIQRAAHDPSTRIFLSSLISEAKHGTPQHSEEKCECFWCHL